MGTDQLPFPSTDPQAFPKAPVYEEVVADALLGDGLVTVTGLNPAKFSRWQFHRKLLTPMFHFKALKDMIPMMVCFRIFALACDHRPDLEQILYTKDLVEHLETKGAVWHRGSEVLSRFTLSQIVWLAFGGTMDMCDPPEARPFSIPDFPFAVTGCTIDNLRLATAGQNTQLCIYFLAILCSIFLSPQPGRLSSCAVRRKAPCSTSSRKLERMELNPMDTRRI